MRHRNRLLGALLLAALWSVEPWHGSVSAQNTAAGVPRYEIDPSWPPRLPNNWIIGVPTWVAVDRRDHVWVLHRPRTAPAEQRANAAPAVIEFDPDGKFVQAWGGPGNGYDWPDTEHGIFVDANDRVWITGINPRAGTNVSTRNDDMILKFTASGKFIQQIGGRDVSGGNKDTKNPHQSAEVFVYPKTNEAFIADGYGNRRVWVIDAETGAFKRAWGAFGKTPLDPPPTPAPAAGAGRGTPAAPPPPAETDGPGPDQYGIVHGTKVSNDGLVYVADRGNRRLQVFSLDGKYINQGFVNRTSSNNSCGTVAFSPDAATAVSLLPRLRQGRGRDSRAQIPSAGRRVRQSRGRARAVPEPSHDRDRFKGKYLRAGSRSRQPAAEIQAREVGRTFRSASVEVTCGTRRTFAARRSLPHSRSSPRSRLCRR